MPDFTLINGRLHQYRLRSGGQNRAIVFVNSLGTDLRIWDEVISLLPNDMPILSYDKSGHGLSGGSADSIDDLAADLASLMDHVGTKDALICGVSVGGMIAQALASTRPDLVAGLVLCSTSHRIGTKETWGSRIAAIQEAGLEAMADEIMERWFSPAFRRSEPYVVGGYRMMLTRTPAFGYLAVCAAIRDADLTENSGRLNCPTLCVAGGEDRATPPDLVECLANLIPGAQIKVYDEIGHLPCIEAPQRLAGDIMMRWDSLQ